MIRMFAIAFVIFIGAIIAAPFIPYLAPDNSIYLVQEDQFEQFHILAQGQKTLWVQWQSWFYIGLFTLCLCALISALNTLFVKWSDKELSKKKSEAEEEKKRYQELQQSYKLQCRKEADEALKETRESVEKHYAKSERSRLLANKELSHAEQINKRTNLSLDQERRETRSKMAQRDRLREKRKNLAQLLESGVFTYNDGSVITINELDKIAKRFIEEITQQEE